MSKLKKWGNFINESNSIDDLESRINRLDYENGDPKIRFELIKDIYMRILKPIIMYKENRLVYKEGFEDVDIDYTTNLRLSFLEKINRQSDERAYLLNLLKFYKSIEDEFIEDERSESGVRLDKSPLVKEIEDICIGLHYYKLSNIREYHHRMGSGIKLLFTLNSKVNNNLDTIDNAYYELVPILKRIEDKGLVVGNIESTSLKISATWNFELKLKDDYEEME